MVLMVLIFKGFIRCNSCIHFIGLNDFIGCKKIVLLIIVVLVKFIDLNGFNGFIL